MGAKKISILFCDDERLLRTSLAQVIQQWSWIASIDMAANGEEALAKLKQGPCDLLLLDVSMPGQNGAQIAQTVLRQHPLLKVVMLTNYDGEVLMTTLHQMGVHGILLKDTEVPELEAALKLISEGGRYYSTSVQKIINGIGEPKSLPSIHFAPRHKQVMNLLIQGKSVKEIAEQLSMSVNTINSYKSDMMALTNTQSTVELVSFVQKNGIA